MAASRSKVFAEKNLTSDYWNGRDIC